VVRILHDTDQVNKADKDGMYKCCHAVKTVNICTAKVLGYF